MADARVYWVPFTGATTETVDWSSDPVMGWGDVPERQSGMARAFGGPASFLSLGASRRVTIRQPRMGDRRQAMNLLSVQSHLEQGGHVGFSLDHDKSVLAYATTMPTQGDTSLTLGPRQGWNTSATLAAGDYVWIVGSLPGGHWECRRVSSWSASGVSTTIGLDDAISNDYTGYDSVAVFWARYLPYGVWPPDARRRPLVVSDDDKQWIWDFFVELELDRLVLDEGDPGEQAAMLISNDSDPMVQTPGGLRESLLSTNSRDPRDPFTGRLY